MGRPPGLGLTIAPLRKEPTVPNTPADTLWWQVNIDFPDPATTEHTGIHHVAPALERTGHPWFLMRKKGTWRCRIHLPNTPQEQAFAQEKTGAVLNSLVREEIIAGWTPLVYEPEVQAFGGPEAMDAAHSLWCADTHHLIRFLAATAPDRRREASLLLCHTLMRAADLDHFEQGDVWDRVAALRPLPSKDPLPDRVYGQVHRMLSVDPGPHAPHFSAGGAFAGFARWAGAFQRGGATLASLNARGRLQRGLRGVLAHLVIFHWNRLGLAPSKQAVLSHAATRTIFDPETVGL